MPFRYFIKLAFDGTQYHGWQYQENALTVQQVVTEALSTLLNKKVELTGCGRTDTGVHAHEYYAHFNSESEISDSHKLTYQLNSLLPHDIVIYFIKQVDPQLHARYSAIKRTYLYYINYKRNPFNKLYNYTVHQNLDIDAMNDACLVLKEYSDFSCFSKTHTQVNNFKCILYEAYWTKTNDQLIFTITANRFLRNMVRAIVGTLIEMGQGKKNMSEFRQVLENRDRSEAGVSVPAKGLFLEKVIYPEGSFLDRNNK